MFELKLFRLFVRETYMFLIGLFKILFLAKAVVDLVDMGDQILKFSDKQIYLVWGTLILRGIITPNFWKILVTETSSNADNTNVLWFFMTIWVFMSLWQVLFPLYDELWQ